ncbi:hypothetical protein [Tenacibaculum maritimum]|uniref:hypothetical protein n=1 Tax=Tenacibaculum maritimum TaxID=107401 RepID=UPI0012E50CFE|nr:hypothetical protein [Tenacibaculum maritimum]CAA0202838.1 conserved hypothetical protein [Tenacibaculum maritimum]
MTIFILDKWVELEYIQHKFTEGDLERAINSANNFFPEKNYRLENVIQLLLNSHIENPPNEQYKYILTPHAKRFLEFLGKKLFNEHTHFPLRETFQNYGIFKAEEIKTVKEFETWFEFNFKNSSKRTIEDHLEGFKDLVNNSILKLNELTIINDERTIENLENFVVIFKEITSRENEIRETFHLSGSLKSEIRKVVDRFENSMLERPNKRGLEEQKIIETLKEDYNLVLEIKTQVFTFFELVESKLEQIVERYIYADKQLAYYKENFRTRSLFQINLRKFLEISLSQSLYNKDEGIIFNTNFPLGSLVYENFKYIYLKYIEEFRRKKNYVVLAVRDKSYEREQLTFANRALLKQERIAKLIQEYKEMLRINNELNVTSIFYNILESSSDKDIASNVIHELIQFASKDKNYSLNIQRSIPEDYENKEILIWKIDIQK